METGDERVCLQVKQLSNLIQREFFKSEVKKKVDTMTFSHGWVIGYLYNNRNRCVLQSELEKEFRIRRSTITKILQLMEKNGLICRVPVENDARKKQLVLTPKAMQLHMLVINEMDETDRKIKKGINKKDLDTFFMVINKMKSNLEDNELW